MQKCAKLCKQNCENPKKLAQLKKICTDGISRFFHLCAEEEVKVINVSEIPDMQLCRLGELPSNCVFFYHFIKEDIRILPASRVQEIGENKVDFFRAAVSEEIQSAW